MSDEKKTLSEEDIDTERGVGRRSAMGVIGASVAAAAGVMAFEVPEAEAQCTDSDGGRFADPGGRGRRCRRRTGCSDPDGGRWADPAGRGRRCSRVRRRRRRRSRGCTDSDGGRFADAAGRGRRCRRSCSDPDGGRWADPAGRGRRC